MQLSSHIKGRCEPMQTENISKILVAIDFSPQSIALLDCVYDLYQDSFKEIILAHVFEDAKDAKSAGAIWQDVMNNLSKYKKELLEKGFNVKIAAPAGEPAIAISELAKSEKADLILIASSGKGYIQSALLGSTSFDVARLADCPVFIERGRTLKPAELGAPPARLRKVLLPTDFSLSSLEGLSILRRLSGSVGEVLVAHVIEKSRSIEDLNTKKKEAERQLAEIVDELQSFGVPASYVIKVEGTASRVLLQLMREEDITLTIMPRTGAGIIKGLLIGSTAQAVLLNIDRPILMIPSAE